MIKTKKVPLKNDIVNLHRMRKKHRQEVQYQSLWLKYCTPFALSL